MSYYFFITALFSIQTTVSLRLSHPVFRKLLLHKTHPEEQVGLCALVVGAAGGGGRISPKPMQLEKAPGVILTPHPLSRTNVIFSHCPLTGEERTHQPLPWHGVSTGTRRVCRGTACLPGHGVVSSHSVLTGGSPRPGPHFSVWSDLLSVMPVGGSGT